MAAIGLSKDPSSGAFDLDDLKKHNGIEHDGSLSRKDFNLGGEEQNFCPEVFAETLSYYDGAQEVGLKEVAAARWYNLIPQVMSLVSKRSQGPDTILQGQ